MEKFGLSGKVVVVTGAGSGIGRELCVQLSRRGCVIAGADINEKYLCETEGIVTSAGGKFKGFKVDVAVREQVKLFAGKVIEEFNVVDIVMNNAGAAMSDMSVENILLEDLEWLMNINFWGVVSVAKAFIPHLKKSRDAYLVNTSSIYGIFGMKNAAAYSASKFAVRGFSEALGQELFGTTVNVMTVFPGGIATNIARDSRWLGNKNDTAAQLKELKQFEDSAKTTPEQAACEIIKAMEDRRKRLLIGSDAKFMDFYVRMRPENYGSFVRKHIARG